MSDAVLQLLTSRDPDADADRAAAALADGKLVVLPTETVYGVAARIDQVSPLNRLKALRGESTKPWTLHLSDPQQAWDYLGPATDLHKRLVRKLWPGPVGLVFDVPVDKQADVAGRLGVAANELFEDNTITLRCPDHPVFSEIVHRAAAPIALTKLDGTGGSLPKNFDPAAAKVDLAVDAGPTRFSKPSTLLRVFGDRFEIVRAGVFDERIIQRMLKTTVLFVCSGNTCRSPMAEALTRKIISDSVGGAAAMEARGIEVASAGVYALNGTRASPQAVEAVGAMGADLSRHRSQALTPELLHSADLVLVMGRSHASAVKMMSAGTTVLTLDPAGDIEDPIGSDVATYRGLAEQMKKLIQDRLTEGNILG